MLVAGVDRATENCAQRITQRKCDNRQIPCTLPILSSGILRLMFSIELFK